MIFGMTPLTFVHVVISLIGIGSGLMVVYGLLAAKRLDGLDGHLSDDDRFDQRHGILLSD